MSGVEIRTAREEDAGFVYDMVRSLAAHVGELEGFACTPEDVVRDGFGPDRHYESLIATVDEVALGLATYFFTYSTSKGRPCLFVLDLIVAPEARGKNLGRELMSALAEIAVAKNCCRVDLHVHNQNQAQEFYKAIGLHQTAELPFVLQGPAMLDLARR